MTRTGSIALIAALALAAGNAAAQETCATAGCHTTATSGRHSGLACASCHEGAAAHQAAPNEPAAYPRVHFDQEVCYGCHADQYETFEIVSGGETFYGGSDGGPHAPKGWSKTVDLPYWNVLIDGHPFVLETYEDRPMAVNQIEHQETIRPGSEACMECHGTRAAFMMGIEFVDKAGVTRSIPAEKTVVFLPDGVTTLAIPAKVYEVRSLPNPPPPPDPVTGLVGHVIFDGTSHKDPATGEWKEVVSRITIPVGTKVWTYTDGVNLSGGPTPQPYEVRTLVTLPEPVTVPVLDPTGVVTGSVTFDTLASFPEAGADINGRTGYTGSIDMNVANVARLWIYAALEALAFDGLDYHFDDPCHFDPVAGDETCETRFTGGGANWPSVVSGELCNQCHDPHSGKMRIVKKSLVAAIGERGVNPYSPTGANVLQFEQASRQDQIVALCAQCHSEYVGGYSANTKLDQDYFPWAKPADLEALYGDLFGGLQDWTHGGPIVPWQSDEANARGFLPYGERYVIGAPLVKVQHPEAEVFFNSPMYNAGATCTDCHSARVTRSDGTRYTSHWFTSPIKIMDGFDGVTSTGVPVTAAPANPCAKCHVTDTIAQSKQRIRDVQDAFFFVQERAQVALVNALRFISSQPAGPARDANVATYQRAAMRWEYYTQAENSMGFHNAPEATTEVTNARLWVDAFVPWPLTPVNVRITSPGTGSLTLTFFDQANDEQGFRVERATALAGPYGEVAHLPTPNGANLGDVSFTDTGVGSGAKYFYRVLAYNAAGSSVPSIWAEGTTQGVTLAAPIDVEAVATSASRIDLTWTHDAPGESGFRIERARDAFFTQGFAAFEAPANATGFSDREGLAPGTTYNYRVFAFGAAGTSAPSSTVSATTFAAPPAAPTNLVVIAVGPSSIALAWKDNSGDETGFQVERSADGVTFAPRAQVGPDVRTFTDGGLPRRTLFYYRVSAFNASGTSAATNRVSARTR